LHSTDEEMGVTLGVRTLVWILLSEAHTLPVTLESTFVDLLISGILYRFLKELQQIDLK
jgi:hypothetical protein